MAEVQKLPARLDRVARRLMSSTELSPYAHTCFEAADVLRKTEAKVVELLKTLEDMRGSKA